MEQLNHVIAVGTFGNFAHDFRWLIAISYLPPPAAVADLNISLLTYGELLTTRKFQVEGFAVKNQPKYS